MIGPMTFDILVGLAFLIATLSGALFGFFKMALIVLAFYSSVIAGLIFTVGGVNIARLMMQERVLVAAAAIGMPLVLIALAIAFGPRAKSAAGHIFGALLAAAWTIPVVLAATITLTLANPDMRQVLREKTLTGPALFTVAEALASLLPDYPGDLEKPEGPKV